MKQVNLPQTIHLRSGSAPGDHSELFFIGKPAQQINKYKQHARLPMAEIALSPLHRADGSSKYSKAGYSIVAAVNGPIEVQRRDEMPEEATVDVAVRPAAGVGGE